ncbi:MAG: YdiU family protein [Pseudomonadota bacterium]|nr:YdiU family protein [Pseudomonadota bacterium]
MQDAPAASPRNAASARTAAPSPADAPLAARADAIRFDNVYAALPERFHARLAPARFPAPALIALNPGLAETLGISPDFLASPEGLAFLAGQDLPPGADPLAMAYAGHQFGGWVPQLGDGRAILLGEVALPGGGRRDLHLKGGGRTPFSRGGDGRAALGPVLREYLVSEAMYALGVPTTRALAAILTGETVARETELPGAALLRVANGHVRVGTFQYFYARQDLDALRRLTDLAIARNHPAAAAAERPALALLQAVAAGQAALIARWMSLGFIHGVMNTDNMSVACETIDYGPCAFMEAYHPETVYSSIDQFGRYAYANQPRIAQWNLAQLAQCLLPLIEPDPEAALPAAQAAVDGFADLYEAERLARFREKLGLAEARPGDAALIDDLLEAMAEGRADFTLTFRALASLPGEGGPETDAAARALFDRAEPFDAWARAWRARLAAEGRPEAGRQAAQRAANPAFIPRNHRVEEVITAATERGDLDPFARLLTAIVHPFDDQPERADLMAPARPEEAVTRTFCGT